MNDFSLKTFLVVITIAVCWASPLSNTRNGETKADCPSIGLPCWSLPAVGGKCYCFSTDRTTSNRIDWIGADKFCRGVGMTLISLETKEEDQMISNHIKGMTSPELNNDYYWTSGRYSQEGKNRWEWATTQPYQPMSYTNWFPGYPNNSQPGSYAYVNYNFETGMWFNENNAVSTYILFICESIGSTDTTTFKPTTDLTTTEEPTTEAVTTDAVTTEAGTTDAVTTDAATTDAVTTEAVTTDAATTEAPTTDAATTEAPTTDAATTDAATTDAITTDAATTDAVKTIKAAISLQKLF